MRPSGGVRPRCTPSITTSPHGSIASCEHCRPLRGGLRVLPCGTDREAGAEEAGDREPGEDERAPARGRSDGAHRVAVAGRPLEREELVLAQVRIGLDAGRVEARGTLGIGRHERVAEGARDEDPSGTGETGDRRAGRDAVAGEARLAAIVRREPDRAVIDADPQRERLRAFATREPADSARGEQRFGGRGEDRDRETVGRVRHDAVGGLELRDRPRDRGVEPLPQGRLLGDRLAREVDDAEEHQARVRGVPGGRWHVDRGRARYLTRMPGCAPESGERR